MILTTLVVGLAALTDLQNVALPVLVCLNRQAPLQAAPDGSATYKRGLAMEVQRNSKLYGRFDEAVKRYEAGESTADIGEAMGVDQSCVFKLFKTHGVVLRSRRESQLLVSAKRAIRLRGKRIVWKTGYVKLFMPEHPRAYHSGGNYVWEHVVVAEKKLGRPLTKAEVVHHINHDKSDNRPENLIVFPNQSSHLKFHTSLPLDLEGVVIAWPTLPKDVKMAIVMMVKSQSTAARPEPRE
jgi:hypothetical protein